VDRTEASGDLPYGIPRSLLKPLGNSRVPWAHYLNGVHNRVHPFFADQFLVALNQLPTNHPSNQKISSVVDLVLEPGDGDIAKIAVVRSSGVEAFDAGVVDAVRKAAPFGAPPVEILSEDGKVHFQWVIHRDVQMACSTYFMKPLLLKSAPSTAE
jgi:TonB family protein